MRRLRHDRRRHPRTGQGPCGGPAGAEGGGGERHPEDIGRSSAGISEGVRYAIAIGAAALAFLPSVAYDRHAKKTEALTYTVVREF